MLLQLMDQSEEWLVSEHFIVERLTNLKTFYWGRVFCGNIHDKQNPDHWSAS